jgi:hypothetical protein
VGKGGGEAVSDHIPDVTKMIGETPRTDAAYFKPHATMYDLAGEMKLMERELNAANDRINRLEEAGGQLMMWLGGDISDNNRQLLEDHWRKAKKAKP